MKNCICILLAFLSLPVLAELYISANTLDGLQAYPVNQSIEMEAYNDFDERSLTFQWDFGDGSVRQGRQISYSYSAAGAHLVTVTATASDGEQSEPFYFWLFITPPNAQTYVDAYFVSPEGRDLVLKAGERVTLLAGSEQEDVNFFWHLNGTELFYFGNPWDFEAPADWGEFQGTIELTAIHSDGSAMAYPNNLELYVYENNHPPDAHVTEPVFQEEWGEQFFVMNPGDSQVFRGTAEDPDGPNPLTLSWYDIQNDTYFEGAQWQYSAGEPGIYYFSLNAMDADGQYDPFPDIFYIWVRGENQPPQAWIQSSSQTAGIHELVYLEAGGDDPEGDSMTFSWDLGDGRTAQGQGIEVTYDAAGVYKVGVTAQDSYGASSGAPFQIWVFVNDYEANINNQNPYPSILAPEYGSMFQMGEEIVFSGFGFDADPNDTLQYYWEFGDGTLAQGSLELTHSFPEAGTYWASFFVRDQNGYASFYGDFTQFAVYEGAKPPDGKILSPEVTPNEYGERIYQVAPGDQIQLRATVNGVTNLAGYTAQWLANGTQIATGFQPPAMQVPEPGFYLVYLNVTDPSGKEDPVPAEFTLWVRDYNTPPHVFIDEPGWDMPIHFTEVFSLSASAWDEEDDPVFFTWTLSDGRTFTGERVDEVRFSSPGMYWVQLEGVDSQGAKSEEYQRRYIIAYPDIDWDTQEPPDIRRLLPREESFVGPRNSQFQFSAEAWDYFGESITEWLWDFGNGTTSRLPSPGPVTYSKPGGYEVRVFAKNASGLWTPYPAYWHIAIYGDNIPPNGEIYDPALVQSDDGWEARLIHIPENTSLGFSANVSDPDGNLPVRIEWWFEGENEYSLLGTTSSISPISFTKAGWFNVSLYVEDSKGEADPIPDYRTIHVIDPAIKPTAYIGYPDSDLTVEPGEELWFYGYGDDPNELELSFQWDFGTSGNPSTAVGQDVFPVVFWQETPPGQPIVVKMVAKTEFTSSDPVYVNITVKQYHDKDFEPNDDLTQAFDLNLGSYSQMSLGGSDLLDYYTFTVTADSRNFKLQLAASEGDQGFSLNLFHRVASSWEEFPLETGLIGKDALVFQDMPVGEYALEVSHQNASKVSKDGISYGIGISTEKPVLYVPFLVEDGNWSSDLGLINPSDNAVDVSITGVDDKGKTVVTKTMSLGPGERFFQKSLSYFGVSNSTEQAKLIKWIRIQAPERLIGFSNSTSRDESQQMSSGAFKALNSAIIIPHIAQQTQQWYTRAVVVNATEEELGLQFKDASNTTPISNLKANGQEDFRFNDLFAGDLPGWGRFSQTSGEAALAGVEIFGRKDGVQQAAALEMASEKRNNPNFTYIRNNIYFTHVAKDTANFWTGITLVNTEDQTQTCRIKAYNDEGQVLSTLDQTLNAKGKLLTTVENLFPTTPGISWLEVEADRGISGFVLFGDHGNKRLAGFPAADFLTNKLIFPYVLENATSWTGIAVLNISAETVTAQVKGFSNKGVLLHQTEITLASKTKKVETATNLFPGQTLSPDLSYITVETATKALNGFELFGSLKNGSLGENMAGLSAQTE